MYFKAQVPLFPPFFGVHNNNANIVDKNNTRKPGINFEREEELDCDADEIEGVVV